MIKGLSGEALQEFMKTRKEKDYLVVDVRQPEEYRLDHIPGSVNIPLAEVQFDPYIFENERDLVFCCTRGARCKVAAVFVSEAGHASNRLFYLQEGLFEYSGELMIAMPKIGVFPSDMTAQAVMRTAVGFEKAAYRFYRSALEKLRRAPIRSTLEKMAKEEKAHAKSIFRKLNSAPATEADFQAYFDQSSDSILEGGKSFKEVEAFLRQETSNPCMDILDFAIEIEYNAYDLYKTIAEKSDQADVKQLLFHLAEVEKKHLDRLITDLELCVQY